MKIATILSVLALTTFTHAGPLDWLKPDALSPEKLDKLKSDLSLTEEQQTKIQTIVSDARSKASPIEEALREQQTSLDALVRNASTTADSASASLTKLLESESALKQNQLRAVFAIRDVLTPEQQRKIASGPSKNGIPGMIAGTPLGDKAARIKTVVDALGITPTEALKERGAAIEAMIQEGRLAEAEAALDKFITESGADEPDDQTTPDFNSIDPGSTEESVLRERLSRVTAGVQRVISIPLMRKMVKAKEALDNAISSQDAVAAGRILSWAEAALKP